MVNINGIYKCCGCHACFNACPQNAIRMQIDENGFKVPYTDKKLCVDCKLCEKVCPLRNKSRNKVIISESYAMYNLDKKTRLQSSSGGIFSLLAEWVLDMNGVVFGAMFDNEYNVIHGYIEDKSELYKFRGSKYVQSTIGNSYKMVKDFLDKGRFVLFTGTPCQIAGLKGYLNKKYDNLLLQDIVCHGVPSPKIWKIYLEYMTKKFNEKPRNINFREKTNGWNAYEINIEYSNYNYKKHHREDLYMNAFLKNFSLRDSCYECQFKGKERNSDITLADFWGIDEVLPGFSDNKGVSLVIINSEKGKEILNSIKDKVCYKRVVLNDVVPYNACIITSVEKPKKREWFFKNISEKNLEKIVKKCTNNKKKINSLLKNKIINYLKQKS